jgi:hypothetical protein
MGVQVEWNNAENPGMGFKFIYLTDEVYTTLAKGTVNATKLVEQSGEVKCVPSVPLPSPSFRARSRSVQGLLGRARAAVLHLSYGEHSP